MTKCDCEGTYAVTYCKDCGIGTSKAERIAEVRKICQESHFVNYAVCCVSCHTDEVVQIDDLCCSAQDKVDQIESEVTE